MLFCAESVRIVHCVHREGVPDMSLASLDETHLKPAQLFIPTAPRATCTSLHAPLPLLAFLLPSGSSPGTGKPVKEVSRGPNCLTAVGKAEAQFENHLISCFWKDLRNSFF